MFEHVSETVGEVRDVVIETAREVAETVRGLVVDDREDLLRERAALLDAPPPRSTLREIREAAERADEERAAAERMALESRHRAIDAAIRAAEPAMLRTFRSWLVREENAALFPTNDNGARARRPVLTRPTERTVQPSARPTKAETNAGWLTRVAAAFAAARRALSDMQYLPAAELATAIAMHRAAITAAVEAPEFEDFPLEELWRFNTASPRMVSWQDRPETW